MHLDPFMSVSYNDEVRGEQENLALVFLLEIYHPENVLQMNITKSILPI